MEISIKESTKQKIDMWERSIINLEKNLLECPYIPEFIDNIKKQIHILKGNPENTYISTWREDIHINLIKIMEIHNKIRNK